MLAVKNTLPQMKAQTLSREYKQRMLQVIRDAKKLERQRQQHQEEEEEEEEAQQRTRYSFANLPTECLEIIFSHVSNPYTLARAALTCTAWRQQAISNKFWQTFMQLTFGKSSAQRCPTLYPYHEHGSRLKFFSNFESKDKMAKSLLPWRTDRIVCHNAVRWCSPETRARVIKNAGDYDKGIAWSRKIGVTFSDPQEVVLYLITGNTRGVLGLHTACRYDEIRELEKLGMLSGSDSD